MSWPTWPFWPSFLSWCAVGLGAALGAWLRWGLGLWLNGVTLLAPSSSSLPLLQAFPMFPMFPMFPLGTLVANLGGGLLSGLAFGFFSSHPGLAPEWRLFAVTGFLGGLTTFSAFSAESLSLLQRGDYGWAVAHSGLHVFGALACCALGFALQRALAS